MVSRKKDFIGKRSLSLPALTEPGRLQLVGVMAAEGQSIPVGAQIAASDNLEKPQPSLGHVTSHGYSATFGRHIGLALLKAGREMHGQQFYAVSPVQGLSAAIEVLPPCFYDPDGGLQRG